MKTRKTRSDKRRDYTYSFSDGRKVVLKVGEDGVTEMDIKMLHSMDDSEVYYNNKNLRPNRSDKEKEEIQKWKKKYVEDFKAKHGYEPNQVDVDEMANEVFPRNYNLSLDYDQDGELDSDKKSISYETSTLDDYSEIFSPWSEKMESLLKGLTDRQREILNLRYVEGYKQVEIARMLGISSAGVKKHLDKAEAFIKKNYK
ncbi:RNA polymerase sigma factor [Allofustis seminis]|uniref:RNA polymerase sigma factor n=1 Tax=Allofustis seminis TaxID=166939 RepID=UPI000379EE94|nr:sigma-70 family RNA polymerase sigma factor [Allofustis seminis]